jgi:hypothetical protein
VLSIFYYTHISLLFIPYLDDLVMQAFDKFDETLRKRLSLIEKTPTAQLWEHIVSDLDARNIEQNPDVFDDVFKTRLSSIQKNPSPDLWNKISIDTEEKYFNNIFATKLADTSRQPSPNLWERIESDSQLNTGINTDTYKDFWRNKFSEFAPAMDSSIWKKVVNVLEDDAESSINGVFKKSLTNLEVVPHPSVWNAIEARLDERDRKGIFLWSRLWMRLFFVILSIACFTFGSYLLHTTYQAAAITQPSKEGSRTLQLTAAKPTENVAIIANETTKRIVGTSTIDTTSTTSTVSSTSTLTHSLLLPTVYDESLKKNIAPETDNYPTISQSAAPTPTKPIDSKDTLKITTTSNLYSNLLPPFAPIVLDTSSAITRLPFLGVQALDIPFAHDITGVSNTPEHTILEEQHPSIKNVPSLYIGIMPLVTYHNLSPIPARNNPNNNEIKNIMFLNQFSRQRLGLQFGGGAELPLSKRISIRTGVTYSRLTQRLVYMYKDLSVVDLRDTSNQLITFGPVADKKIEQNQHIELLGLQLGIKYDILSHSKIVQSVIGSLEGAAQIHVYDNKKAVGPFVSEFLNFANLSYRAARKIGTSNYIWVEAKSQIPLSSYLDSNRDIRIKPTSIGLNVGISWLLDGKSINVTTLRKELTNYSMNIRQ